MKLLEIDGLHVTRGGKIIINGLCLTMNLGEINVIMGPNGSGKSTLSNAIMGHPNYKIEKGTIKLNGEDITHLSPTEKARKGIFLGFQYPSEISGVTVSNFIRTAMNALREKPISILEFKKQLQETMKELDMDEKFAKRYLNEGFSGGEKKKAEVLQMAMLNPKLIILDELDSGVDIDNLKVLANGVNKIMNKDKGLLLITHYQRILDYIKPDKVHIMLDGKLVKTGGPELAKKLEEKGYDFVKPVQLIGIE